MNTRTGTAVVIHHTRRYIDGRTTGTLYGPFLPHAGSAVTTMLWQLDQEGEDDPRCEDHASTVQTVFIGEGESDAALVATR